MQSEIQPFMHQVYSFLFFSPFVLEINIFIFHERYARNGEEYSRSAWLEAAVGRPSSHSVARCTIFCGLLDRIRLFF